MSILLTIGALSSNEWLEGYLEFAPFSVYKNYKDTSRVEFEAGLSNYIQEIQYTFPYSQQKSEITEIINLNDFVNDFNAGTSVSSSYSYGQQPIDGSIFSSTTGLLAFSVCLQIIAIGILTCVQYKIYKVGTHKYSLWLVRLLLAFSAFFNLVGILVYGTSSIKLQLCSTLDPDAQVIGKSCGYSNGFGSGIVGLLFILFSLTVSWATMSAIIGNENGNEQSSLLSNNNGGKAALFSGSSFQSESQDLPSMTATEEGRTATAIPNFKGYQSL